MCAGIYIVGLIIHMIRGSPTFYPFAMIGGAAWCTGNILCVPIISRIGMGIGLSLWGGAGMVFGWLSSVTGMMGQKHERDKIDNWYLNVSAVICTLCAMSVLIFVKSDTSRRDPNNGKPVGPDDERSAINSADSSSDSSASDTHLEDASVILLHPKTVTANGSKIRNVKPLLEGDEEHGSIRLESANNTTTTTTTTAATAAANNGNAAVSPSDAEAGSTRRKIEGVLMSLCAGFLFGVNFNFVTIVMDTYKNASQEGLDYVYSHFSGIFFASTIYFMSYCAYNMFYLKQAPDMNPLVSFPGFISGLMWAIAQAAWFVANGDLSQLVTWPIVSVGPSLVAYAWGIFYLKEIQGARNFKLLGLFACISGVSTTLVVLSRG